MITTVDPFLSPADQIVLTVTAQTKKELYVTLKRGARNFDLKLNMSPTDKLQEYPLSHCLTQQEILESIIN